MPTYKYVKPRNKISLFYRGPEMRGLIADALGKVMGLKGKQEAREAASRLLKELCRNMLGGEVVMIIERFPLYSMGARGKAGNEIYSILSKTGTQRVKAYKKPFNPQSRKQQAQRRKYDAGVKVWNGLSTKQKERYVKKAKGTTMTGYNMLMKEYLRNKKTRRAS